MAMFIQLGIGNNYITFANEESQTPEQTQEESGTTTPETTGEVPEESSDDSTGTQESTELAPETGNNEGTVPDKVAASTLIVQFVNEDKTNIDVNQYPDKEIALTGLDVNDPYQLVFNDHQINTEIEGYTLSKIVDANDAQKEYSLTTMEQGYVDITLSQNITKLQLVYTKNPEPVQQPDNSQTETDSQQPSEEQEENETENSIDVLRADETDYTVEVGESITINGGSGWTTRSHSWSVKNLDNNNEFFNLTSDGSEATITAKLESDEIFVITHEYQERDWIKWNDKVETFTVRIVKGNHFIVNWYVNGQLMETDRVVEGTQPSYDRRTPERNCGEATFAGWATEPNSKNFINDDSELPEVTESVDYYAVFTTRTYFYFLLPNKDSTSESAADYMYSGEGLVIVPDGFNVEDRWYSSSYNLDQYIINYPSDAAIRKGLASYYDGQWHHGESSRRPLYTEDWTYTYDAITLNVGNTSVGYDYETINYGNTHHIDMQISYDDRENVGIAYQVVQPDGTVFYRASIHKLGENVNINNTVSTSEDFNTDGYTYKSIIKYNGVDYKFDGWYSDENYQTKAENSITASEMRTFYAKYIPAEDKVTINYKSTDTSMGTVTVGSETILSKTGQANGSVATPNTGYTFVGWYDNEDCNGEPISTDENLIPKKPGSEWESVTYYAKFEEKEGLVRYNLTGGTWTSEWQTDDNGFYIYPDHYLYPDTFTVTNNVPVREGYVFVGWLDKERESHSGSSEATIRNAGDEVTFIYDNESEDKVYTLDAVWAKIESTPKTEKYNGANIFIDPVEELTYYTSDKYEGQLVDDLGIELRNVKYQLIKINDKNVSKDHNPDVATPSQKNVSVYTYKITGDVYIDGINEGEVSTTTILTITPRDVTLTSATDSKQYDGKPLTNDEVTVSGDGFVEGEGASYNVTGTQTLVGSSENYFTYELNAGTDAGNYNITTNNGTLTVTNREAKYEITVVAKSGGEKYNGSEQTVSGFETTTFTVDGNTYTVEGLSAEATATDAGVYPVNVTGTAVVRDADNNDVTAQFSVKTQNGQLNIGKRDVTLTSATDSKQYDGKPLTNDEVTVSGDGFVEGEGASYNVTGTQTLVGSSENYFTYELNAGTDAGNYNITTNNGTLTVTNREAKYEITVVAKSGGEKYNGSEQTVSGFETTTFTVDGNTYTVEGLSAEATATDAGVYPVNVTGTAVVRDADNNDVTAQFSVKTQDGKLTITPADVTITVEDDSKIYGQADPEFAEPDVVGLVNEKDLGEITVIRTNSEVETVGNYQDVLDAQYTPNPNYTVEVIKGDFEIKAQSINPSDPSYLNVKVNKPENKVYDGKDHKWIPEVTLEDGTPLVEGTDYTVTYSTENFKDVQKIKVTIEGTGNYSGTVTRKYRITRKPITVTTDSAIKVYDGSALTADGRVEGIVDGETYGFVITGTQTEVGSSKNTYKIEWTGSAKEGNYTIDKDLGTLTVVPQSIDPEDPTKPEDPDQPVYAGIKVDKPEDKVYDGQEHKWTPTVTLSDGTVLDPENYEVSYDTQDFVNVTGKITVTITGTGNYAGTVTREYQITPRAVTITSADDSKVYDGTPLTNGNVSVTQGSLVSEEDITFKATGSQTEVGSSANTIEVTYANEQMEKNYKVTLDEGTLTVTEKPAGSDSDKDSESADGEDTATATNVGIFASLATSALAGLGILTALKKKRKD
ncbi:MBG domain-containing protein [Faecalicoccus pleomorphus]|uniref:MBG domain-containing protein n=2 Tax=Faecalicoccus pleomorphus TaxID=1323 RepID=UPI00232C0B6C|nr:MBG domain-containing protein [Faecalicoccus pleomorphus]MDB7990387.1 MBG domain-containing protein [Faecalicoccus pleomorphus]